MTPFEICILPFKYLLNINYGKPISYLYLSKPQTIVTIQNLCNNNNNKTPDNQKNFKIISIITKLGIRRFQAYRSISIPIS